MLKVQFKDSRQPGLWLVDAKVTLGRDVGSKLVVADASVSPLHAEFVQDQNWWYIEDLGSQNGTFVNGQRIQGRCQLRAGDQIRVGNVELMLIDSAQASTIGQPAAQRPQTPWMLQGVSGDAKGKFFPLQGSTTLGRSEDCGVCVKLDTISRHHCELTVTPNGVRIKDLGSANGTNVNHKKITDTVLKPGDQIHLDGVAFLVIGPRVDAAEEDDERTVFKAAMPPPPTVVKPAAVSVAPRPVVEPQPMMATVVQEKAQSNAVMWVVLGSVAAVVVGALFWFFKMHH